MGDTPLTRFATALARQAPALALCFLIGAGVGIGLVLMLRAEPDQPAPVATTPRSSPAQIQENAPGMADADAHTHADSDATGIKVSVYAPEAQRRRYEAELATRQSSGDTDEADGPQSRNPIPRSEHVTLPDMESPRPRIALVIDDAGVDVRRSRQAIELPGPLTIAFLPYGYDLSRMVETARGNGHEILLHLPMEPVDAAVDPGPNALLTDLGKGELMRRLTWNLERFGGYVGLNNHMGSRFSADEAAMRLVMVEIKNRGLLFLDSITTRDSVGRDLARQLEIPYAERDVFLDHDPDAEAIRRQLMLVETIARRRGFAVAIAHPHDATLNVLRQWLPGLADAGFRLVPISAIVTSGARS